MLFLLTCLTTLSECQWILLSNLPVAPILVFPLLHPDFWAIPKALPPAVVRWTACPLGVTFRALASVRACLGPVQKAFTTNLALFTREALPVFLFCSSVRAHLASL